MPNGKEAIVDVKDVVKKFIVGRNTEITILKGISFKVYPGEFVIIVGPSGNGKSTLLNMCTGIDFPNAGQVLVTNKDIHDMNANKQSLWRGKNVGIIFQFFQMMPSLTLYNNVMLPMELAGKYSRKERKQRAAHLLEIVGLQDQMHKLPSRVSGGQQQRAAISRALANDPPLLIADEPTGNLDPQSAAMVFDIFKKLVEEGKTIMMVTHDRELSQQVSRKIEIVNGNITKDENRYRRDWTGT